jgi:hypothetical protein
MEEIGREQWNIGARCVQQRAEGGGTAPEVAINGRRSIFGVAQSLTALWRAIG